MTLKTGLRVFKVIKNCHHSIERVWLPINFHSNNGPISSRFRDRRRFQSKIVKCSHPLVFCILTEGATLGIGYRRWGSKTRMMWLPGRERSLTISLAVWIQSTNVTGGQTLGDSKYRAYAWRRAAKTKDRHKSVECISQCDKMTSVHLASQKMRPLHTCCCLYA